MCWFACFCCIYVLLVVCFGWFDLWLLGGLVWRCLCRFGFLVCVGCGLVLIVVWFGCGFGRLAARGCGLCWFRLLWCAL